jgi:hypothetical protein
VPIFSAQKVAQHISLNKKDKTNPSFETSEGGMVKRKSQSLSPL